MEPNNNRYTIFPDNIDLVGEIHIDNERFIDYDSPSFDDCVYMLNNARRHDPTYNRRFKYLPYNLNELYNMDILV